MSMKRSLYMLMAMSVMMGGMGYGTGMGYSNPAPKSPPRKLTPEEETAELEKRQQKFLADLDRFNSERKQNFPKFKEFLVHGFTIIAHSQKNAIRDMNRLMRQNYIAIKEESDVQVQG